MTVRQWAEDFCQRSGMSLEAAVAVVDSMMLEPIYPSVRWDDQADAVEAVSLEPIYPSVRWDDPVDGYPAAVQDMFAARITAAAVARGTARPRPVIGGTSDE